MPLSNITGILQTVTPFLSSTSPPKKKPGSLPPDLHYQAMNLMNENCWDQRNQSSLITSSLNRLTENSKVTPEYTGDFGLSCFFRFFFVVSLKWRQFNALFSPFSPVNKSAQN